MPEHPTTEETLSADQSPDHATTDHSLLTDTSIRAELYCRGDAVSGLGVQEMVARANRLAANGVFSDSVVAGQWHHIQTQAEDWRSDAMATYEAFQDWAQHNGCALEPAFQERTRSFIGMDDIEEVVVFPVVALALYDAEGLAAVFPCTDGERTYTVESALAAFERGDESWLTQFDSMTVGHAAPRLAAGTGMAD